MDGIRPSGADIGFLELALSASNEATLRGTQLPSALKPLAIQSRGAGRYVHVANGFTVHSYRVNI